MLSFPQSDLEMYNEKKDVADYVIFYDGKGYCKKGSKYWRYDGSDPDNINDVVYKNIYW